MGRKADPGAIVEGRSGGQLPALRSTAHGSVSVEDCADADASSFSSTKETSTATARFSWMAAATPKTPSPTWYGDSIGKWEGDTLVVDTVGFNDKFWFDFAAHPHTEKLHVIERFGGPTSDIWISKSPSMIRALTPGRSLCTATLRCSRIPKSSNTSAMRIIRTCSHSR